MRSALGVQQPIPAQLAHGQAVGGGTSDATVPANGCQPFLIRQGDTAAFVACELLAESYLYTGPMGSVAVGPLLVQTARGIIREAHTQSLMAIAPCESGARIARDKGGFWCTALSFCMGLSVSGHVGGVFGHLDR